MSNMIQAKIMENLKQWKLELNEVKTNKKVTIQKKKMNYQQHVMDLTRCNDLDVLIERARGWGVYFHLF